MTRRSFSRGNSGRSSGSGARKPRNVKQRLQSSKPRSASSRRWLERQLSDSYVHQARAEGYRSRAAYKLLELDAKFHFLASAQAVVDLGAAPGGWSQAVRRSAPQAKLVAIDRLDCLPIEGATILTMDFTNEDAPQCLLAALGAVPDLILSDMSAETIGHRQTDHLRNMVLVEAAAEFAIANLTNRGTFVAKIFAGGSDANMLALLKQNFAKVKQAKPKASRKTSPETYIVAQDFRR